MRKAFTMIEIVFVITIIGILAAVALPKLAANRDNASASICTNEVGQLIHEIGNAYLKNGYSEFKGLSIGSMTNIKTNVGLKQHGIFEGETTKIDTTGVTYYCEGEALVQIVGNLSSDDYNLSIIDKNPITPIAMKAAKILRSIHGLSVGSTRYYKL